MIFLPSVAHTAGLSYHHEKNEDFTPIGTVLGCYYILGKNPAGICS